MKVINDTILVFHTTISDKHAQLELPSAELLARRGLDLLKYEWCQGRKSSVFWVWHKTVLQHSQSQFPLKVAFKRQVANL